MLTTEHPGGLKAETLDSGMIRLERNDVVLVIEPEVLRAIVLDHVLTD